MGIRKIFAIVGDVTKREIFPALRHVSESATDAVLPDPNRISGREYHAAFAALEKEPTMYSAKVAVHGKFFHAWAALSGDGRMYAQEAKVGEEEPVDGRRIYAFNEGDFRISFAKVTVVEIAPEPAPQNPHVDLNEMGEEAFPRYRM